MMDLSRHVCRTDQQAFESSSNLLIQVNGNQSRGTVELKALDICQVTKYCACANSDGEELAGTALPTQKDKLMQTARVV